MTTLRQRIEAMEPKQLHALGYDSSEELAYRDGFRDARQSAVELAGSVDEGPVTEEWLRSIGFIGDDDWCLATSDHDEVGSRVCMDLHDKRTWLQATWINMHHNNRREIENVPVPFAATRADVLALLAALHIPLPEKRT